MTARSTGKKPLAPNSNNMRCKINANVKLQPNNQETKSLNKTLLMGSRANTGAKTVKKNFTFHSTKFISFQFSICSKC